MLEHVNTNQEECIQYFLHDFLNQTGGLHSLEHIIAEIGQFYAAHRSYIFEISEDQKQVSNTYEWCAENIAPEIDNLQNMPIELAGPWLDAFRRDGHIYINDLEIEYDHESDLYKCLEPQGIVSLMAVPMTVNGEVVGFLGLDNPHRNIEKHLLLSVVAASCYSEIAHKKRILKEQLENERKKKELLQKSLLKAEAANRAKSVFLNNISHDIRTPMNAILGFTTLAESHLDDKALTLDYLHKIGISAHHLLALINDVLDMSRIESGNIKINEQPTTVKEILQELQTIVQNDVDKKKLNFNIIDNTTGNRTVCCDKLRLDQILLNLVSNAIKFTPEGGHIKIKVDEEPSYSDNILYHIEVMDDGSGIDKKFLPHIFEPFAREKSSTISKMEGTGLGLPIVKRLLDLMGGKIFVRSEVGKGSLFHIDLRLHTADYGLQDHREDENYPLLNQSKPKQTSFAGKRILLVEDNELNQEIATILLEDYGMKVTTASNGKHALETFKLSSPDSFDVILMDIMMPDMNGYEATRAIRALADHPDSKTIPIIAMTANAFAEDVQASIEAGMDAHIAKPLVINDVIRTLNRFVKR